MEKPDIVCSIVPLAKSRYLLPAEAPLGIEEPFITSTLPEVTDQPDRLVLPLPAESFSKEPLLTDGARTTASLRPDKPESINPPAKQSHKMLPTFKNEVHFFP